MRRGGSACSEAALTNMGSDYEWDPHDEVWHYDGSGWTSYYPHPIDALTRFFKNMAAKADANGAPGLSCDAYGCHPTTGKANPCGTAAMAVSIVGWALLPETGWAGFLATNSTSTTAAIVCH